MPIHITALVLSGLMAAPSAQPAPVIAIDGEPPQAVARLDAGRWVKAAETLRCGPAGAVDRLVVTGGARPGVPRSIAADAPERQALDPAIVGVFDRRQREHDLAAAHLAGLPMQIDWIYASGTPDGADIYYFEASRRVPDPGTAPDEDPKGTLRVAVSGWLHRAGGRVTVLGSKSELRWEQDRQDGTPARRPDLVPLGTAAHDAQSIWVMKGAAGDAAWVSAYQVGESGVLTVADAVRCMR